MICPFQIVQMDGGDRTLLFERLILIINMMTSIYAKPSPSQEDMKRLSALSHEEIALMPVWVRMESLGCTRFVCTDHWHYYGTKGNKFFVHLSGVGR